MSADTYPDALWQVLEMILFQALAGNVTRVELRSVDGKTQVLAYVKGLQPLPRKDDDPHDPCGDTGGSSRHD